MKSPSALPVIAIVGRPNVGKSTLFNQLTRSRDALVADEPGLTRDRQYGRVRVGARACLAVDTGGLTQEKEGIDPVIVRQSLQAVEEADVALFLTDARDGLTPADSFTAQLLRRTGKPVFLVVNKIDGLDPAVALGEFHGLGLGPPHPIAAAHGRGVSALMQAVLEALPETPEPAPEQEAGTRVAVLGRPNVGKSTLVNRMVGQDRVVAFDQPGTTRDSIFVPFERDARPYVLIDTAGMRRRGRVSQRLEKYSVIKAMQAVEAANVVILVVDAREGVTEQDAHLLGFVLESGRALVIAANKWDGLDTDQRARVRRELERRFAFVDFAQVHFISALHGTGVGHLFEAVDAAWESASRDLSTPQLTRLLQDALAQHPPPLVRGRRIKLRYAHQGGHNPPVIVVHGNQTESLPQSYRRYLQRIFRRALDLEGTPLRLELRTGENPYKGRRNPLTPRQAKRRQRLMRHVKRR